MTPETVHVSSAAVWVLARRQHGVVTHAQLTELGFGAEAIRHRIARGRLHRLGRGVYVVGRSETSRHGRWMAAVLACGPEAALSHGSAAALWKFLPGEPPRAEVSVPAGLNPRRPGIVVHRRSSLRPDDITRREGIPVTTPARTLIDLAGRLHRGQLEAAINECDKRGLTDPEALRNMLDAYARVPGVAILRELLDRSTFRLTASALERRFLALVRSAGLPLPETGRWLNGFKVDFFWPELGFIVETDGLRYHRTPAQQARDRVRDQTHTGAGIATLRFTHSQVRFEPGHVRATLAKVARRLRADRPVEGFGGHTPP